MIFSCYCLFLQFREEIQSFDLIRRYRRFAAKKNIIFLRYHFVIAAIYHSLRESYFNAAIDTITHAEYLDTVRRDAITLPQSYVN
jgi:hypothetical protein